MEFVMLFFSAIIIVCIVGNKLSARIGVPSLLIFLALGMICGSDGILKIPFDNYQLSEQVCTVCLIFIMFCGGFFCQLESGKTCCFACRTFILARYDSYGAYYYGRLSFPDRI